MQRLDGKFARGGHPAPAAQGSPQQREAWLALLQGRRTVTNPGRRVNPSAGLDAHGPTALSVRACALRRAPFSQALPPLWATRQRAGSLGGPAVPCAPTSSHPPALPRHDDPRVLSPPCGRRRRRRPCQPIAMHQRRCPARRSARLAPPPARARPHGPGMQASCPHGGARAFCSSTAIPSGLLLAQSERGGRFVGEDRRR